MVVFSGGALRSPDGDGKKDRSTVRQAIATILPTKNFANQNSLTSGLGLRLGEDIMILLWG